MSELNRAIEALDGDAVVRCLDSGMDPNGDTRSTYSPLITAVRVGFVAAAELLIKAGADIHVAASDGATALWMAVFYRRIQMVETLINAGADVNVAAGEAGATPLYRAAKTGDLKLTRILLDAGAHTHATNALGDTALDAAVGEGYKEIEKLIRDEMLGFRQTRHTIRNMANALSKLDPDPAH